MTAKMKVVCPKCKANLKFDPDKITSEVARFKCPGCATVLRIRKPAALASSAPPESQAQLKGAASLEGPGAELLDLARKFEMEMGFAGNDEAEETEKTGNKAVPRIAIHENPPAVANKKETVESEEGARVKGRDSRGFKRVKFKKKVLVNNQIMVEALDISADGLFLHTGRSFEDGAMVEVGIPTLPGNFDLKVQARVKHNHRGIGMGLQFVDLDDSQKAHLNKLISELDTASSKDQEGRKKILLVGGTDTARNINKSKLMLEGFYVLQAKTADDVFRILDEESPDAMVLEWQEPAFNCKGLLARIKQNSDYDAIIRVVLSALTDSYVQREIMDAGAHHYLAKMNTNPVRLALALKQVIAERDG